MESKNVIWEKEKITKEDRNKLLGRKNKVLWFTGLPCSGKSTLAKEVAKRLHQKNILSYVLDGDNIRHGLNKDLRFSKEDRDENIRRIREVVKLFYDAGLFVLVGFISPHQKARDDARELVGEDFFEIFINCPLEECEKRDVKGMYKKARAGEIDEFTGISAPYEKPENPEMIIETHQNTIKECVNQIIKKLDPEEIWN